MYLGLLVDREASNFFLRSRWFLRRRLSSLLHWVCLESPSDFCVISKMNLSFDPKTKQIMRNRCESSTHSPFSFFFRTHFIFLSIFVFAFLLFVASR